MRRYRNRPMCLGIQTSSSQQQSKTKFPSLRPLNPVSEQASTEYYSAAAWQPGPCA
jgi:hypothetical protein